jgi:hypothetical protein
MCECWHSGGHLTMTILTVAVLTKPEALLILVTIFHNHILEWNDRNFKLQKQLQSCAAQCKRVKSVYCS